MGNKASTPSNSEKPEQSQNELEAKAQIKDEKGDHTEVMPLYWDKNQERRGLGNLIGKANHIARVVSDIGRSLWFYSDVLGLQQIRRPNFDRHGAWLTLGNIELHLILGKPSPPEGGNLIVGHISLESNNIGEVLKRLQEMQIPFETNVSVPKGGIQENEGAVTQFFLRDPDGYYIELCNCDILTDFCFGNSKVYLEGYEESGIKVIQLSLLTKLVVLAIKAKKRVLLKTQRDAAKFLKKFDETEYTRVSVDEEKLQTLVKRTKVYGDIVQGETEDSLKEILQKTKNSVPDAMDYIEAKHEITGQVFQPPTIYKNNDEAFVPDTLKIED